MFSRFVEGRSYTFGVSGKLWKNGLVMYDHQTETLWSGVTGEALQGPLTGKRLTILAAVPKVRWRDSGAPRTRRARSSRRTGC